MRAFVYKVQDACNVRMAQLRQTLSLLLEALSLGGLSRQHRMQLFDRNLERW